MEAAFRKKISVIIVGILIAAVYFLIGVNKERVFQSEIQILLLPKDDKTQRNIDQVISNAERIPLSLSFHDKLVEKRPDLDNSEIELLDASRKEIWNSEIETGRVDGSGIISIKSFQPIQFDSEELVSAVADDLITVMSRYYNIKTELEIRKIEGPISQEINRGVNGNLYLKSLLAGLASGIFIFLVISIISGLIVLTDKRKGEQASKKNVFSFPYPKQEDIDLEENPLQETKGEKVLPEEKPYFASSKKASAPDNLPVGNEFVLKATQPKEESEQGQIVKPEKSRREATPEEVKERLNKLLRGGL